MQSPIIKPEQLVLQRHKTNLVLIDARTGPQAREQYKAAHLDKALYVDLESDLALQEADPANGGRHPLPPHAKFAQLLGQLGIHPESHVVVYDDKHGANAAARFWWMLKAMGHKQVQVVDGGYAAALAAGMPVSSTNEQPTSRAPYKHSGWKLPAVTIDEVWKAVQQPDTLIIDVRDPVRFRGEKEPLDLIAGHIPGAINIPFTSNLGLNDSFCLLPCFMPSIQRLWAVVNQSR